MEATFKRPYPTLAQAEEIFELKPDPSHRGLKRFLCYEIFCVKRFNGNRKRVSRARLEKVMDQNIEYVSV